MASGSVLNHLAKGEHFTNFYNIRIEFQWCIKIDLIKVIISIDEMRQHYSRLTGAITLNKLNQLVKDENEEMEGNVN